MLRHAFKADRQNRPHIMRALGKSLWRHAIVRLATLTALTLGLPGFAVAQTPFPQALEGHGGPIRSIALSADRTTALTASFDYAIIVWDLKDRKATIRHRLFGHDAAVNDARFVPGSNEIVSVSDDGSFAIWDATSGTLIKRIDDTTDKVLDVAVSPDGTRAVSAKWDETARLYNIKKRVEIAKLEGHRGVVNAVAFSSDGNTVYTGSYDGTIRAWDAHDGRFKNLVYNHGWGVNVLALVPGRDKLIFGGLDGTLGMVDLNTNTLVEEFAKFERPVLALDVSTDGKTLASGDGAGFIHLYDTTNFAKKRDAAGSFGPIWGLVFTGNNDTLYHVGLDDFASWHALDAKQSIQPIQSKFPRRFQLSEAESVGKLEFQRKCSVCHTLTPDGANRAGPTLHGVFGRKAGTLPGYDFSSAIIKSGIIWDAKTIAQLVDDGPDVMIQGTKMPVQRLKSIERRDELVEFLERATAPKRGVDNGG